MQNAKTAQRIIAEAVGRAAAPGARARARRALATRDHHEPDAIPEQTKQDLAPIIGKYIE